jgi:hypothetical protein
MLADLQVDCPNTWESSKMDIPGGEIWLNATSALANCAGEEEPAADSRAAAALPSTIVKGSASSVARIDAVSAGIAVGAMLML